MLISWNDTGGDYPRRSYTLTESLQKYETSLSERTCNSPGQHGGASQDEPTIPQFAGFPAYCGCMEVDAQPISALIAAPKTSTIIVERGIFDTSNVYEVSGSYFVPFCCMLRSKPERISTPDHAPSGTIGPE